MVPTVSWPTHLRRVKLSPWESIHLRSICYFKANYFGNPPNHTAKMLWIPQKGSYTSPIPQLSVILRFYPVLSTLCIRKVPQHMQFLQDLQSLLLLIAEDEVLPTCQGKWDQTILVFFQVSSVKKKTKCNNADIGFTQNTCFWETYPMLTTIPVTIPVDETWSSSFGEAIPYPNRKNHVPSGDLTFCNWKYPIYSWFTYSEWWFSIATLVYQRVTFN